MAERSCNLIRSALLVKVSFGFWVCSFAQLAQGGQIVNVAAGTCLTLADGECEIMFYLNLLGCMLAVSGILFERGWGRARHGALQRVH